MKALRVLVTIMALLLVMAIGTVVVLGFYLNSSVDEKSSDNVVFAVPDGASFNSIADRLQDEGLIRSSLFLKVFNKVKGSGSVIKVGSYNIDKNLSTLEIVKQLEEGKQKLLPVVISEGLTIGKIDSILSEAGITDRNAFTKAAMDGSYLKEYGIEADSLEGFLFPDTYSFQQNYPAEKVVQHMVDVFFQKLESVYPDYKMLTGEQIYEKIVLSSIIEREYRVADEAPVIASVFYNRIDQDWMLQSCATIVYVITEELKKEHPERILFSDLEIESEYNTYKNKGLPPAPISNPGTVALDAVFSPAQTEYMFFVVEDIEAGRHSFAKDYGDHLRGYEDYVSNFRSK